MLERSQLVQPRNQYEDHLKTKNKPAIWPSSPTPMYLPMDAQRASQRCLQRDAITALFSYEAGETAELFVSRGMGKETVVYITVEMFSVIEEDWSDVM